MKKPKKTFSNASLFFSFLTASRSAKGLAVLATMDPVDERILLELALHWKDDSPISVVQTMHEVSFVSTTTAHRRLKQLRKIGMIDLAVDTADNRVKYVIPTEKTMQYLEFLGQCVRDAQLSV